MKCPEVWMAEYEHTMSCILCGTQHDLGMVAQRNKYSNMIGWLFICLPCYSTIADREVTITFGGRYKTVEVGIEQPDDIN